MNFDLKKLDLEAAAIEKCDLLAVLVPEEFKPGRDELSALVAQAIKQGTSAPRLANTCSAMGPRQRLQSVWCFWEQETARRVLCGKRCCLCLVC